MIRFLLALAGALALAACSEEPEVEPSPSPAAIADWPDPAPALWEVIGSNGEQGWLFGTIHALPEGVSWRTEAFDAAFSQAGLLMVEIDNLGDAQAAGRAFDLYARSGPQRPLGERVHEDEREGLAELLERARMTERDFWNVKTWAAALILGNAVRASDPGHGVDRTLLREGKPVDAMESFASQFARFDGLSEQAQGALLAGVVREAREGAGDPLARAWLTGDIALLDREMAQGFLRDPELRNSLLAQRNRLFASRLVAPLERGRRPFVAVGAAHMLGDDGLPALLARRGYTVRRIQ